MDIEIGDYVRINENKIDKIVQQFLRDNKNRLAVRWDSYRNIAFIVIGRDAQNLIILQDSEGNKVHISQKFLDIVHIP